MGNLEQLLAEVLSPFAVTIALAVETESSPAAAEAAKGSARLENRPGASARADSRVKFAPESDGRGVRKLDSFAEKLKARVGKPVEKLVEPQVSEPVLQKAKPVLQGAKPVLSSDWAQFAASWQDYESAMAAKWGALSAPAVPSRGGSAVSPGVAAGGRAGEPG